MFRSSFSDTGLDIGSNNRNITQLYGLSDFFALMFQDSSKIDLLMEATTHQCSEVYSKFLQLTSTLSLKDIQTTIGYQTKLLYLNVGPNNKNGTTFTLSEPILGSRLLSNRPFLPTLTLEEGVHYSISADGLTLTLFTSISLLNFPSRLLTDGVTKQYAIWVVDALVDEQLITQYYGNILGLNPEASTDMFKNFVYGILFLYTNGPNLEYIRKGLNLSLGIPLVRNDNETVVDIRKYLDTNEFLVTTDQDSYIIPYGLQPTVSTGDILSISQELAQWVEVKDYLSDGDWWINLQIPQSVVPYIPTGQDRTAHPGGYLDYIMSQYLRKHTFLVNVNVVNFKNIQTFTQLYDIIKKVKPSNTTPIYIWSVPIPDEVLTLDDEYVSPNRRMYWNAEDFLGSFKSFTRDNSNGYTRDVPMFTRFNMSRSTAELTGNSIDTNLTRQLDGGTTTGTIGMVRRMRTENEYEGAQLAVHFSRGNPTSPLRSNVAWLRDFTPPTQSGVNVQPFPLFKTGQRIVPLHAVNWNVVQNIISTLKLPVVRGPKLELFKPNTNTGPNSSIKSDFQQDLVNNFNLVFTLPNGAGYLGNFMPPTGYQTYTPLVTDIQPQDYIMVNHILDNTYGVFWVTSSTTSTIPSGWVVDEPDQLSLQVTSEPTRGLATQGFPYYQFRGASYQISYNTNNDPNGINQAPINSSTSSDAVIVMNYTDTNNPGTIMLRNGTTITVKKSI